MKKYNWVAQDADGEIYNYEHKPDELRVTWQGAGNGCVLHSRAAPNPNWKESLIDLSKNDYIIKDGILMATRKHAALIHAWADGAIIQYKFVGEWVTCADDEVPEFCAKDIELRIKPKTKIVKFRNFICNDTVGLAIFGGTPMPKEYEWIDEDWREVEIEL